METQQFFLCHNRPAVDGGFFDPAGGSFILESNALSLTGEALDLAVPRKLLGLKGDAFTFDSHWCDNPSELKDPVSLCTSGESAPN